MLRALGVGAGMLVATWLLRRLRSRVQLSRAKHASLGGHARLARRLARHVPFYAYADTGVFRVDGASPELEDLRKAGFTRLGQRLAANASRTAALTAALEPQVADMQFTNAYRVPFQFRHFINRHICVGALAIASDGVKISDPDGNWSYDVSGSYGVNLLGYDAYKSFLERGMERVRALGPVLGPYHPLIAENLAMLRQVSGLDQVSFHMSGTEAVMQAVRLARYHTGRAQLVLFCGAYHGWWDGVQPGVGNGRAPDDIFTLKDMHDATLRVLESRTDIACVLVNPLQALHPNSGAGGDAMLLASDRRAHFDRSAYAAWLKKLRDVCTRRSIVLVFDEVFVGFRLGLHGAQGYFDVRADLVTYGKTLGGGLPVGVLCGRADLMKRYRDDRPTDVCFARGTFNSHPFVMASMNEFLRHVMQPDISAALAAADACWNTRVRNLNKALADAALPVVVRNLSSICILTYTAVSRYNWMFQFYLRAEGLCLSWVGTGRLIFSHNYGDDDFAEVQRRIVAAAAAMQADGFWSHPAALTNRSIRRRVLREILRHRLSPG